MVDLWLIIGFLAAGIVVFIGSAIGGFIFRMMSETHLERRVASLEGKIISGLGVERRQEKSERMQAAMAEALAIMKDENIPKEQKTQALLKVAAAYPDVALDLLKKLGKGGLPEGLI
jgi:hypothetical protein